VFLLTGIGVGVAFAWWQGIGQPSAEVGSVLSIDERAPLETRLRDLETELALERFERQALADELAALRESVDALPTATPSDWGRGGDPRERIAALLDADDPDNPIADEIRQRFPNGIPQSPEQMAAYRRQQQIDSFVAAGLTPERAEWILEREDELAMEVLDQQYQARREGATQQEISAISSSQILRKELGEADYEKYLEGQGRPTSIAVREVLSNSPAQVAGLQPGDEIVSYNGQRVYEMNELTSLTYESLPGSSVAMQVVRDGQTMQVYVEGGPIGISGGGRTSRRDDFGGRGGGGSARGGFQGGF
jgi:hypothetical protein